MIKYFYIFKKEISIRLIFHFIYIVAIAFIPLTIKYMIDSSFENGIYDVFLWSLIFLICIVVGMVSQYISQLFAWKLDRRYFLDLRSGIFNSIYRKDSIEFNKNNVGEYSSKITNDITSSAEYLEYLLEIVESIVSVLVYSVFLFLLDYRVAIIIYISSVIMLILPKYTGNKLSDKRINHLDKIGEYTTKLLDVLSGHNLSNLKSADNIDKKHKNELQKMENARYEYGKYKTFVNVLNGSFMYIIDLSTFLILAYLLFKKNITVGIATATFTYIRNFMFPLRSCVDGLSNLKSVENIAKNLIKELNTDKDIKEIKLNNKVITLNDISIKLDKFQINNFNYRFEEGKSYLICGDSGTGKSTILKIIMGEIIPDTGYAKIGDERIENNLVRNSIFYVKQNQHIFSEPFIENVTLFNSYIHDESVANILGESRYNKLKKSINCSTLSGGEKNLLAFILALNSKFEIIILDEPFSGLDKKSEYLICKHWLKNNDKMIIMVSHNNNNDFKELFDYVVEI